MCRLAHFGRIAYNLKLILLEKKISIVSWTVELINSVTRRALVETLPVLFLQNQARIVMSTPSEADSCGENCQLILCPARVRNESWTG
ncbi:hypothetical protein RRG08_051972 [Elysia crispata]|uniref:Uncharacterized protein n=1 Tax=Elysia crispata TaxID=231223 RepID=A0AAE0ZEC5_9GAST|nr:hypothetical protein RRG08_051972 [Elysia crispata]